MPARTALDIVLLCETHLGWASPNLKTPLWKVRQVEAGKLKRAMAQDEKVTLPRLELAVELCRRKRTYIKSPVALVYMIDEVLENSHTYVVHELAEQIADAVATEYASGRGDATEWISRLVRAQGPYRADVLAEWRAAGRDKD